MFADQIENERMVNIKADIEVHYLNFSKYLKSFVFNSIRQNNSDNKISCRSQRKLININENF